MVQLEDDAFAKLQKDANDNKQILKIIRLAILLGICFLLFITWGQKIIDLDIQRRTYELSINTQITQAETNRKIFEIESEGLTHEEYFKWLAVRKVEQEK